MGWKPTPHRPQRAPLTIKVKAIAMPAEYLALWQKNADLAKQRAKQ